MNKPQPELCQRVRAIYKPGQPLPGVRCSFHWTGVMPLTGRLVCYLCGREKREGEA